MSSDTVPTSDVEVEPAAARRPDTPSDRAAFAEALRQLADVFETTSLPMPLREWRIGYAVGDSQRDGDGEVRHAAYILGARVSESADADGDRHYMATTRFGPVTLTVSHVRFASRETVAGAPGGEPA